MSTKCRSSLATAVAGALSMLGVVGALAQEVGKIEDITGVWIAKDDPGGATVTVTATGNGVLLAEGSDRKSTFSAACVSFGPLGRCVGHGATRDGGAGFISESVIRLTAEGEIVETWLVQSAEEELSGRTVWQRKK